MLDLFLSYLFTEKEMKNTSELEKNHLVSKSYCKMFDDMSLRLCEKYGDGRKQFPVDNNNFVAVDKKPVE